MPSHRTSLHISAQAKRYAVAVFAVVVAALAAELLYRVTGTSRVGAVFLASVLVTAYAVGSGPAYVAAGLAFCVYNFYLVEPRFEIAFTDAEDLLTLLIFLSVAMLTGNLTGRVKAQAAAARAQARATEGLFKATQEFSAASDEAVIRSRLVHHLASAADGQAFVSADGVVTTSGDFEAPLTVRAAAEDMMRNLPVEEPEGWTLHRMHVDGEFTGVAGWRREQGGFTPAEGALLRVLADTGAAALARARIAAGRAEAEARARTEDLRNALLSSISHDLRTPLAAILASSTSLQQFGDTFDDTTRRDLAATIQEEAERLDNAVANLLNMTRLEAGALSISREPFDLPEVIRKVIDRRGRAAGRSTLVSGEPRLPPALGDPVLFEQAFANVFENAIRYTPADAAIVVASRREVDCVVVEVRDEGPGVPPDEIGRIFEKFYRGTTARRTAGTGLGLSIARGLMAAMQGEVKATNRHDGQRGLLVQLRLEAAP